MKRATKAASQYPEWCAHRTYGLWWFRLKGYGLLWKRIKQHPLLFSQRMGYNRFGRVIAHRWYVQVLFPCWS